MPTPMLDRDDERQSDAPAQAEDALDEYVRAFELAYTHLGGADPAAYLPPVDHPLHAAVLRELVRVDLEYGWERGCPKELTEYQRSFPALWSDDEGLREIAFEEYRLRQQAGQDPSPDEYLSRYGVRLDLEMGRFCALAPSRLAGPGPRFSQDGGERSQRGPHERRISALATISALPEVGDHFDGFRLIGELGRGSFGRVYLARQGELADRPVVLKITPAEGSDESQTLAQLQHDNIVPIYSRHRDGRLRGVCMPYLGRVTLRDVVDDLRFHGALPDSGQGLLSSLGKSSIRKEMRAGFEAVAAPAADMDTLAPGAPVRHLADADATRAMLGALSYAEAVVWMGARLADGLAHAHERGILHRDMKPANILLTDDGRPMLLDFNLAEDLKLRTDDAGSAAAIGGTLPYMAPEHLAAFRDGRTSIDARGDLYAVGVILFEMLTGRPPFPIRDGTRRDVITTMIADRQGAPPRLRPWNPAISPAVESIVGHCLEPDPAQRYRSARELGEDLQRHLAHRPLRYAPDPSPRERATKWFRRHRRMTLATVFLAIATILVGSLGTTLAVRTNRLETLETKALRERFRNLSIDALKLLDTWSIEADPAKRLKGMTVARQALEVFHVGDDSPLPWWECAPATGFSRAERATLRGEAGELLLLIARAEFEDASGRPDRQQHDALVRDALRDSDRAERCFEVGSVPWAFWSQRTKLLEGLGDFATAHLAAAAAEATNTVTPRDLYLKGIELAHQRQLTNAIDLIEQAIELEPGHYRMWLIAGNVHSRLKQYDKANACFAACIAIWPEHPAAWSSRGLIHLIRDRYSEAAADFDQALQRSHGDGELIVDRALVSFHQGRYQEAVEGYGRAIAMGFKQTRVYFMRSRAWERLGDRERARRDREEGLRRTPTVESDWIARAVARIEDRDYLGSLADLDAALAINPNSSTALKDKTFVLAEHLGRTAEAVTVSNHLVSLYPDWPPARGARGVFLARLGQREAALADANHVLSKSGTHTSRIRHQVASIYALTSRQNPDDRKEALRFLSESPDAGSRSGRPGRRRRRSRADPG